MSKFQVNQIIEGTIINIRPFGAIMIFDNDEKGLLHISQIANTYIRNINRYLKVGKTYKVKVIGIEEDGFLKLSMLQITDEEKVDLKSHNTKEPVDQESVDFTALKDKLPNWIEEEKKDD